MENGALNLRHFFAPRGSPSAVPAAEGCMGADGKGGILLEHGLLSLPAEPTHSTHL